MIRSVSTASILAAALILAGCAAPSATTQSSAPASAPAAAAVPAAAPISDAAMAANLKGEWTGKWEFPGFGSGKFVLLVTEVDGTNLKGEGHWFGTATGDQKQPITKASVQNGTLTAEQPGNIKFKLKMGSDSALAGSWDINGYSGPLTAKR